MSRSTTTPALPANLTTRTQLLSPVSLNASPHLPALFKLINHCFNISHNPPGHSYLPYSPTSRLEIHIQLSEEIGPDGFTIIMLAQDTSTQVHGEEAEEGEEGKQEGKSDTVIATASAKPYIPPAPNNNDEAGREETASEKLFKRQPSTDNALAAYAALPKWEILCMVVEPTLQGRGIARQIMGLTIEEIRRRVVEEPKRGYDGDGGMNGREKIDRGGNGKGDDDNDDDSGRKEKEKKREKGEVLLMLSSMQELNETYYAKRGWEKSGVRRFPPGTMGSRDGFGVVEMMKVVSV